MPAYAYLSELPLPKCRFQRLNTEAIKMDFQLQLFLSSVPSYSWAQMGIWISEHVGRAKSRQQRHH